MVRKNTNNEDEDEDGDEFKAIITAAKEKEEGGGGGGGEGKPERRERGGEKEPKISSIRRYSRPCPEDVAQSYSVRFVCLLFDFVVVVFVVCVSSSLPEVSYCAQSIAVGGQIGRKERRSHSLSVCLSHPLCLPRSVCLSICLSHPL